jgi:superfamily II DNA helicase RecQ
MTVEDQDPSVVERIANDLQLSPADLEELVRRAPTADELPRLLEALGISAGDLARVEPIVGANLERVCALCESKRECNRDLASGASAEHYQEYCLNASKIAQLRETWSWSTTTPKMMALIGILRALNSP